MKKIIALALAASMLSTSALAMDAYTDRNGNGKYDIGEEVPLSGVKNVNGVTVRIPKSEFTNVIGTSDVKFDATRMQADLSDVKNFEFNADNFSVSYKVSKGANLVKKPTFDGIGNLCFTFADGRSVRDLEQNVPEIIFKEITVRSKKHIKDVTGERINLNANQTFTVNLENSLLDTRDGSFLILQDQYNKADISDVTDLTSLNSTKIERDRTGKLVEEVTTWNSDFEATAKIYVDDVLTFGSKNPKAEVMTALYAKNIDADLEARTIVAKGFRGPVTVKLTLNTLGEVEAKDQVLYFMDENGALTPANFKWNSNEEVWEGRIVNTTTIVNASKALTAAPVASSDDKKPEDTKKPAVPETGLVVNVDAAIVK